jgi:hypothetical protein
VTKSGFPHRNSVAAPGDALCCPGAGDPVAKSRVETGSPAAQSIDARFFGGSRALCTSMRAIDSRPATE